TIPVDSQNTPTVAPLTSQPTSTTLETSPSKITSSPSLSSPTQQSPPSIDTTHDAEEPATMPHDSPLQRVQSLRCDEGSMTLFELTVLCTNLSNKVTSLEAELAQTKQTYGTALTKLIKKVKKLEQTVKRRLVLEEEKPTELVKDQASGEKGEKEVSTVGAEHNTVIPEVSTAAVKLVYIRSAQMRKDKGKSIIEENECVQKKTKKQLEQEILGHEEAIRL
ncbi:hypothetical protein Tco_0143072, partial [Tanacetum coccineum]